MLLGNPVRGTIAPDKKNYPTHPDAVARPQGSHIPLVTQDFGPTTVNAEPSLAWHGGESDIFGTPIAAKTYPHFHVGLDISKGGCGADVVAAESGKVVVSGPNASGAEVIVIDHGLIDGHRFQTRYAHLRERLTAVDATVAKGFLIGKLGDTGLSTACHLHFAVTRDGRPVDPWRRLAQNTAVDPDVPITQPHTEVKDVPIPASNAEYVAGQVAIVGNATQGAIVRTGATKTSAAVRTVPAGTRETWLPTCWVKGEMVGASDRWLARWNDGQWEFTHFVNVRSVTPL
jgi:hypothetical protein